MDMRATNINTMKMKSTLFAKSVIADTQTNIMALLYMYKILLLYLHFGFGHRCFNPLQPRRVLNKSFSVTRTWSPFAGWHKSQPDRYDTRGVARRGEVGGKADGAIHVDSFD